MTLRDQVDGDQGDEDRSDDDQEDGDHDEPEQDVSAEFDRDDIHQLMEDFERANHSEDENMNALDVRSHGKPFVSKPVVYSASTNPCSN